MEIEFKRHTQLVVCSLPRHRWSLGPVITNKICRRFAPAYVLAFFRQKGNQLALKITKERIVSDVYGRYLVVGLWSESIFENWIHLCKVSSTYKDLCYYETPQFRHLRSRSTGDRNKGRRIKHLPKQIAARHCIGWQANRDAKLQHYLPC
jgi:hypothetical protein